KREYLTKDLEIQTDHCHMIFKKCCEEIYNELVILRKCKYHMLNFLRSYFSFKTKKKNNVLLAQSIFFC
ncbi:MAG: hypothetical protein ACK55Z_19345, partial [bacterium]